MRIQSALSTDEGPRGQGQGQDRRRHADAVVTLGGHRGRIEPSVTPTDHSEAVWALFSLDPEGAQQADGGGDAVGLLDAQLLGVADDRLTFSEGRGDGEHGQLINEPGDEPAADGHATKAGRPHTQVADRLARDHTLVLAAHIGAHGVEGLQHAVAGGVEAHALQDQLRALTDRRRDQEKRR